jgi:hypothetical protein
MLRRRDSRVRTRISGDSRLLRTERAGGRYAIAAMGHMQLKYARLPGGVRGQQPVVRTVLLTE